LRGLHCTARTALSGEDVTLLRKQAGACVAQSYSLCCLLILYIQRSFFGFFTGTHKSKLYILKM